MKCLTHVEVGVESQSAILYVEGEGVDIEVTGADHFGRVSVLHPTIAVQIQVRDVRCRVFIHTAREEGAEVLRVKHLQNPSKGSFYQGTYV